MVVDDAPWAFVFSNTVTDVWQPYVRGYRVHPVWRPFYRDVWLDLPRRRASAADFAPDGSAISWLDARGDHARGGAR